MDEIESEKSKQATKKSSHVRFTDDELAKIEQDARLRGLSIPTVLKEAYFSGRPTAVLMGHEEHKAVLLELLRQGNNLNQITRQANAGIIGNVREELLRIARSLDGMTALLRGKVLKFKTT